jgi:hypothetical protein
MSSTQNLIGAFLGTCFQYFFNFKSHRSISWDVLSTQNLIGAFLGTFFQLQKVMGAFIGTFFQLKISSEHFLELSLTSLQLKISMEHFLGHSFNSKSHGIIFWDIM